MKNQIFAGMISLLGLGVIGCGNEGIQRQQQQSLKELSARVERLERAEKSQADAAASRDELQAQMDRLRKTEAELQAKLDAMQGENPLGQPNRKVLLQGGNIITLPQYAAPDALAPRGATPFEFNGGTYYYVPLAADK